MAAGPERSRRVRRVRPFGDIFPPTPQGVLIAQGSVKDRPIHTDPMRVGVGRALAFPTLNPVAAHLALIAMRSQGDEMGGGHMYAFRPNGQKVSSQDRRNTTMSIYSTRSPRPVRSRATKRDSPTTCAPGRGQSDPQRGSPARYPRLRATATAPAPQSGSSRLLVADSDLRTREAKGGPNSVSSRSS